MKPLQQCYHLDAAAGWVALATEYLLGSRLCQVLLYQKSFGSQKWLHSMNSLSRSSRSNVTHHADWWRVFAFIIRNANKKESFDHHAPYDSLELIFTALNTPQASLTLWHFHSVYRVGPVKVRASRCFMEAALLLVHSARPYSVVIKLSITFTVSVTKISAVKKHNFCPIQKINYPINILYNRCYSKANPTLRWLASFCFVPGRPKILWQPTQSMRSQKQNSDWKATLAALRHPSYECQFFSQFSCE